MSGFKTEVNCTGQGGPCPTFPGQPPPFLLVIQGCVFSPKAKVIQTAPDSQFVVTGYVEFFVCLFVCCALTKCIQIPTLHSRRSLSQAVGYSHWSAYHILTLVFQFRGTTGRCVSAAWLRKPTWEKLEGRLGTPLQGGPSVTQAHSTRRSLGSWQRAVACCPFALCVILHSEPKSPVEYLSPTQAPESKSKGACWWGPNGQPTRTQSRVGAGTAGDIKIQFYWRQSCKENQAKQSKLLVSWWSSLTSGRIQSIRPVWSLFRMLCKHQFFQLNPWEESSGASSPVRPGWPCKLLGTPRV